MFRRAGGVKEAFSVTQLEFLLFIKGYALNLHSSPLSSAYFYFASEAQTTSASFRANTCRFAKAGGA